MWGLTLPPGKNDGLLTVQGIGGDGAGRTLLARPSSYLQLTAELSGAWLCIVGAVWTAPLAAGG